MKKAIVVASFGTSYIESIDQCILPVEQLIQENMPDWTVVRAFTSRIVANKLTKELDYPIQRPFEVLQELASQGYTQILIQPTHLLPGKEYHEIIEAVEQFTKINPEISVIVGESLFYSSRDYQAVIDAMKCDWPICKEGERILLFGHGTEHFSNACYFALQYALDKVDSRAYIATIEAEPLLDEMITKMKREGIHTIYLMTLMLVAGDHVKNDMIGEEDSWKNQLLQAGFTVNVIEKGMGENPLIGKLYAEKAKKRALSLSKG